MENNKNQNLIEGKVVSVTDENNVIINKGSRDNVKLGDLFLIYYLGDEDIIDEDTNENLGKIEYVVGKGEIVHVQEKISTLKSVEERSQTKKVIKKKPNIFSGFVEQEEIIEPDRLFSGFNNPRKGNLVKKI